jgi:hypothetical protein
MNGGIPTSCCKRYLEVSPISGSAEACAFARAVHEQLGALLKKNGVRNTRLFFYGPQAFAIFLGQQLTSVGKVQLFGSGQEASENTVAAKDAARRRRAPRAGRAGPRLASTGEAWATERAEQERGVRLAPDGVFWASQGIRGDSSLTLMLDRTSPESRGSQPRPSTRGTRA